MTDVPQPPDPAPGGLTHLDASGNAHMVDVGSKDVTERVAVAEALVALPPAVRDLVFGAGVPKGDAVAVARVAGIMAAKRTPELVPLCHPIGLDSVTVDIEPVEAGARIEVITAVAGRTGVEMEAITGAAIAAVTLYDMVKGLERGVEILHVRLMKKRGGKSGTWRR